MEAPEYQNKLDIVKVNYEIHLRLYRSISVSNVCISNTITNLHIFWIGDKRQKRDKSYILNYSKCLRENSRYAEPNLHTFSDLVLKDWVLDNKD